MIITLEREPPVLRPATKIVIELTPEEGKEILESYSKVGWYPNSKTFNMILLKLRESLE